MCSPITSKVLKSWCWLVIYKILRNLLNALNTLRPRQNYRHFTDDIFKYIFVNENVWISLKISLKFVPKVRIDSIPALVQIMAWCQAIIWTNDGTFPGAYMRHSASTRDNTSTHFMRRSHCNYQCCMMNSVNKLSDNSHLLALVNKNSRAGYGAVYSEHGSNLTVSNDHSLRFCRRKTIYQSIGSSERSKPLEIPLD